MIGDLVLAALVLALLALMGLILAACDVAEMPPCSAVVVIGSVNYTCPRLPPPNGK